MVPLSTLRDRRMSESAWTEDDEEVTGPENSLPLSMNLFYSAATEGRREVDWTTESDLTSPSSFFSFRPPVRSSSARSTIAGRGRNTFWKKCLLLLILQIGCMAAIEHTTRGLAYEEDQIRLILGSQFPSKPITERLAEEESESEGRDGILSFHPKVFNFKESAVGMPRLGIVRVDNRHTHESVKLISISGSTVHFHASFFADKVISPGGNTTFEIVYLSRCEGETESTLHIHTSVGLFKFIVKGLGVTNPYRLTPLVVARIPLNGTFEPQFTIHNPHGSPIQIVEMLSSVADFHLVHLSLPGDLEEDWEGSVWAIEPFQTKPVMKGCFHGKTEGNHTGYIKIRVNSTTLGSEYLLVPVEVQVSSSPGIYSTQDSLDFGLLVRTDKARTLPLSLINAQSNPAHVQSVSVKGDPNPAVRIEFRPLVLDSDSIVSTVVALVTFDPSEIRSAKDTEGWIEILIDGAKTVIPFRSKFIEGELQVNAASLGFFVKADNVPLRNFSVRNTFPTTLAIYEVSVSHPEIVKLENFNKTRMIPAGAEKNIFSMRLSRQEDLCEPGKGVKVTLSLKSNLTEIQLPITCYDGKLTMYTTEPGLINFGRVEPYSSHVDYFSVANPNPVEIRLKSWGSNSTWTQVELVGMQKGLKEDLTKIQDFDSLKKSLFIQPGHLAVFSVEVKRPSAEGLFWGETFVTTDHNQTLRLPFRFAVSKGSIHADSVSFEKSFPGKISYEKLHLSSTFNQSIALRGVRASAPALSALSFTSSSSRENSDLPPHRKTYVGKLYFDPKKFCGNSCYSGFGIESEMGQEWLNGCRVGWRTGDVDMQIFKTLRKRFEEVKDVSVSNMSLWIDTGELNEHKVKTQVSYSWPRLTASKVVTFPMTSLSNESTLDIPLVNPSTSTVVVQALLAREYGIQWTQFVAGSTVVGNVTEGDAVFSLSGVAPTSSQSPEATVIFGQVQRQMVHDILKLKESSGVMFFLPAGAKFVLRVRFRPQSKNVASTLLLLRNNLTGIETTWIKGRAGTGHLTVGNGVSGSSLLFQLTEKLLEGCQREAANKYVPAQLTVRRSFIARNVGEIPLEIIFLEVYPLQSSFWWSFFGFGVGDPCEGYGFRILNCRPFTLLPNQTHSIDIAFTPDFTMSRIFRTLKLADIGGTEFNFTLVAMVPSAMLPLCESAIARPPWEPFLKYLLLTGIIISIFAAALLAYFEAGSIVSSAVVATVRVVPADSPDGFNGEVKEATTKLDLKQVYDKVDNRFKRNQVPNPQPKNSTASQAQAQCSSSNSNGPGNTARNRKKKNNGGSSFEFNHNQSPGAGAKPPTGKCQEANNNSAKSTLESDKANNNNISNPANQSKKTHPEVNNSKKKNKGKNNGNNRGKNNNNPPKCPPSPSPKIEEETSSTTTESSNADDLNVNLINLMLDSMAPSPNKGKERNTSGKSTGSVQSNSSGGAEVAAPGPVPPKPVTKSKNQKPKKNPEVKENTTPNPTSHSVGSDACSMKGFEEVVWKRNSGNKKKAALSGGSSSSGSRGSISPKQDATVSLWDNPRPPSRNGLSEFSTPSESFSAQRNLTRRATLEPSPISTPAPKPLSQIPPLQPQQITTGNSYTSNSSYVRHGSGGNGGSNIIPAPVPSGTTNRRPGVIGQPRPQPANPTTSSNCNGFMNSLLTTAALTMTAGSSNSGQTSRQHTPPARTLSSPNSTSSSSWLSQSALPDNGCAIWNRSNNPNPTTTSESDLNFSSSHSAFRPSGASGYQNLSCYSSPPPPVSSNYNYSSSSTFPSVSAYSPPPTSSNTMGYSQSQHMGGSGMSSYGNRSCPSPIVPPSQPNVNRMMGAHKPNPGYSAQGTTPSAGTDSYFNGTLSNDLLNNLWQLSSSFEATPTAPYSNNTNAQVSTSQAQAYAAVNQAMGAGSSGSQSNSSGQHNYLQRIRSDPNARQRPAPSNAGNSGSNWLPISSYYGAESHSGGNSNPHRSSNGLRGNNGSIDLSKGLRSSPSPTQMNSGWPIGSPAANAPVNEGTFTDWGLGLSLEPETNDIWNGGRNGRTGSKWHSTYAHQYADPMPIGTSSAAPGGQRLLSSSPGLQNETTTLSGLADGPFRLRTTLELTQSQREVEAGLGFNPFISDIWNQPEASGSTWSNPYQYPPNNE